MPWIDALIESADMALRTVSGGASAARPIPRPAPLDSASMAAVEVPPTEADRRLAGALMRVNHVGEVCAQALYTAQGLTARTPELRAQMRAAARDETDHLAWTEKRLAELGDRTSLLNPLWFAGAFAIGLVAGRAGDRYSLGFVAETERQVEQHLAGHLDRLPADDAASRAIVQQMKVDEARHAEEAMHSGGVTLPAPVRWAMRAAARVMTTTARVI
jgi:ubiquinone biosynthesis monooxygenase Coq7